MASLFGVSLVLLLTILPVAAAITYAVMAGFFPAGWAFLGRYISPSGGYLSPVARWMNLLLQAAAAACLGVVLGPVYLYKAYRDLAAARDLNDAANKH